MAMVCLSDFEGYAKKYLPKIAWDYFAAGADDCNTRDENILAYKRIRFRPRMLRDVSMMDIRTKILGTEISFPVGIAPTGFHQLAWPDGEKSTARAAKAMNTCYIASTYSTCTLEEISVAAPGGFRWFQLYIHRNRAASQQLVQRAEALGFQALVLTADLPYTGKRRDDIRNGFRLPPHMKLKNLERDFEGDDRSEYGLPPNSLDPSVTWNDIYWLQSLTRLPIIIKGILTKEDAELAVRHGVQGIIVSNHGGRQLDEGPATIDALVEVVEAVRGRVEVYLDGGIRKGTDVLKALALGAKCVFIGRPALWGLAYKGEEGLQDVLRILQDEFRLSMALAAAMFDPLTDSKLAVPKELISHMKKRVVGHWNRIPREVVSAPNLPEFKKHLENGLRHMAVPESQRLADSWFSSPSCEQSPAVPIKQRQLKLRSQPD